MTVTQFWKTVAYAVTSVLVMVFAVWIAEPMYNSAEPATTYLRSIILLFVTACGVLGVGAYSFFAYTKRHREHRSDSWFLLLVGGVLLLLVLVITVRFGGITQENYNETAHAAVNLNLVLTGVLPLPFLVRTAVLSLGVREVGRTRWIAPTIAVAVAVIYVALVATGHLLRTVEYESIV